MKQFTSIPLLFLMLFALPFSDVLACDAPHETTPKAEKTCCSGAKNNAAHAATCAAKTNGDDGCTNGGCNNECCQNPVSPKISITSGQTKLTRYLSELLLLHNWKYTLPSTDSVYLPIWQPPKIS